MKGREIETEERKKKGLMRNRNRNDKKKDLLFEIFP